MQRICTIFTILLGLSFFSTKTNAQVTDTLPTTSVDPALLGLFHQPIPKKYTIAEIKVTGAQYFDPNLVTSISGLNVGDEVRIPGGDNFAKAIEKLWGQNLFADIEVYITKVEGDRIWVEIAAVERPRLSKLIFRGIKKSEATDLKEKVGITASQVVTEARKQNAIEAIQKFYTEKGFQGAKITVQERPDTAYTNGEDLIFIIEKGGKVRVNDVMIFGNEKINELKLKKQLKGTKEKSRFTLFADKNTSPYGEKEPVSFKEYVKNYGFLSPTKTLDYLDPYFRFKVFSSAKFNEKKYREDKTKIIEYYNANGYRDAVIEKDTVYYNAKGNLNVAIKISEGHKYYFGDVTWRGNTKYSDSILNVILGIKKGDVYNLETLNKRVGKELTQEGGDISALYADNGYLFFRVDPVETSVYNDTIDHEIRITEGPQATIKRVTIAGNDKTKEHVIRRELRTLPGEKFSRQELIRSQREIANLGYFNQEKIGINPVPNPDDGTVDINYTVEEKSSDQLELSAGWGGGIGLTGTVGVVFNNFSLRNIFKRSSWSPLPSGDGQKLSLRFQSNGRYFRSTNFSFTEPWLGGKKRNSFTLSLYSSKYANAYDPYTGRYTNARADSSYLKAMGATISLGKQLKWPDDYFTLIYALNYTQYKLKNYPGFFQGLSDATSNILNLKLTLARSSVNQPIFPTGGSSFMISGAFTPPYSAFKNPNSIKSADKYKLVEYHKWRVNGEWYVPLGKPAGEEKNRQFVLKVAAKYGFIGRYNKDLEISPFERFQVGDAGLTNNFGILGYDIIAHRGYPVYDNSDPTINPDQQSTTKFFTIFNKYTMELRYPFSTNPSSTIYGLAFFEAANGWYDFKNWNPFQLRRSVGLGARFFLPMFGLLGFDYGLGLDRLSAPGATFKDATRFTFMLGFEPE
ncbi:BamA/OMP85 family outer membrane protein [Agriterribacter sp.]|uniref:BamA/OMP85 family outer membrane protein n=1 Tax=Agriterribacter sp. TaxID=2821509 RepID=UPI002B8A4F73|nr:POTRA domain-containing protein [Agriterribacter sp.]HTN07126.1 POTRA domain-containing protein [Agriterribacter sp.]